VWIDAASVKHYLNAIKAKQSALDARKPLIGGREPHLDLLSASSFGSSSLAPTGIHHLLLSNLTTGAISQIRWIDSCGDGDAAFR